MAKRAILSIFAIVCFFSSSAAVRGAYWTNAGVQHVATDVDWGWAGQRYVAPGTAIRFRVGQVVERDTYFDIWCQNGVQHNDELRYARLKKTGGTVSGTWDVIISLGTMTYTVPATATAGQTIEIKCFIGDNRTTSDTRHDAESEWRKWDFVVSSACPDGIVVDALKDDTGQVPAGETRGRYVATMKATGTPPAPRANWDGVVIGENVGASTGDPTKWVPGILGLGAATSSFTIGYAGTNCFYDTHKLLYDGIALAPGVNVASMTQSQVYICSATDTYSFTITKTGTRLFNPERVKISVTK